MEKKHFIFLIAGEVVGYKNFISTEDAREYALDISKENQGALVGYYEMISVVASKISQL